MDASVPTGVTSRVVSRQAMGIPGRGGGESFVYFQVFYAFYAAGDEVSSAHPVAMERGRIYAELVSRLDDPDDFVGIIDQNDEILQVSLSAGSPEFLVEILLPDHRASYARLMTAEQLEARMISLPALFQPNSFPEFEYQDW